MNENKEYLVYAEESGSVRISEDVIATLVNNITLETEGVASLATVNSAADIADFFTKKAKGKGIKITFSEENGCNVDIAILVKYGHDIKAVAQGLQQNIKNTIESMAQLEIKSVNVLIDGIVFDTKQETKTAE